MLDFGEGLCWKKTTRGNPTEKTFGDILFCSICCSSKGFYFFYISPAELTQTTITPRINRWTYNKLIIYSCACLTIQYNKEDTVVLSQYHCPGHHLLNGRLSTWIYETRQHLRNGGWINKIQSDRKLHIGTWTFRGQFEPNKLYILLIRSKVDIWGISKIFWTGEGPWESNHYQINISLARKTRQKC